ncbi:MAG: hypothetical protein ABIZ57_07025 [Candidatus Limnocylindria bacterium]
MVPEPSASSEPPSAMNPVTSLDDPRAIQILSTEHWSLLSARSLAYNEAFVRGGMFLTFLSTSFVALALFSTAMSLGDGFLAIAAIVLAFDFILGLLTYGRIIGANMDDMRAVHGMSRIRHGYTEIAPILAPYFTTGINDDEAGVMISYGNPPSAYPRVVLYGLTTSGGMIGLIVSLVGGVLAGVLALIIGASGTFSLLIGVISAVIVFVIIVAGAAGYLPRQTAALPVLFPTPQSDPPVTGE